MHPLTLVLHNIRSTYNVGAILRTAECAGVSQVYLCGYTPDPVDRFGRKRADIAKAALGAEELVAWEHVENTEQLLTTLKSNSVRTVALEQHTRSHPYTDVTLDTPTALVLGEEVHGLPEEVVALCDEVIEIPMHGEKESLNVSVAAGVAVFALLR